MGKDSGREKDSIAGGGPGPGGAGRRSTRPVSASPYSEHYRPPIDLCERHLINHRLLVSKLSRRELEDKYLVLCDENYTMKKRFLEQEDEIKRLKTRLMRLSNESPAGRPSSKSRHDLSSSEHHYHKLHDLEQQRKELHEKLEALRRATLSDVRRVENVTSKPLHAGSRHSSAAAVPSLPRHRGPPHRHHRSKSAHHHRGPSSSREPSRCKSSSPSYEEGDEEEEQAERSGGAPQRRTDEDEDDTEGHRRRPRREKEKRNGRMVAPRKSYGADDEDDGEEDDEEEEEEEEEEDRMSKEVDEDRDIASGTAGSGTDVEAIDDQPAGAGASGSAVSGGSGRSAVHAKHHGPAGGRRPVRGQGRRCADCERHRTERLTRETDYVKMKLNIKYLHKELQNEKEKSALLARQLEEKLSYEVMKRNAAENLEILSLNRQVEEMARELQRQADDQRRSVEQEVRKQGELEGQIRKEKDRNGALFEECERLKKSIEKLKESMSEVEIERDFLRRQQDNFTKIVDENKLLKYQLEELRRHNQQLLGQLDALRAEEAVTKDSQRELLEKLKTLQQDNDTLSVMLEGLRTENEVLAEEKTQLEQSLKSLEASPIRDLVAVSPLATPQKPLMVVAAIQTDGASTSEVIAEESMSKECSNELQTTVPRNDGVAAEAELPNAQEAIPQSPLQRSSKKSPRTSHQEPTVKPGNATRLLQRASVSQMLPRLSYIMNNQIEEPTRPSNMEILLTNSYPTELQKSFANNEQFRVLQKTMRKRESERSERSIDMASGSPSDRRKISFLNSSPESPEENYARLFDIGRTATVWHAIANPLSSGSSPATESSRSANDRDEEDAAAITIEVHSLQWHESAYGLLQGDGVSSYYVEFTFLDLHGHQLETPGSVPLLTEAGEFRPEHTFQFRVQIALDERQHAERRERVRTMLASAAEGQDAIRFVVVNDRDAAGGRSAMPRIGGDDLGYASFRLRSALLEAPPQTEQLIVHAAIYDFRRDHDELGVLTVKVGNVKLLRALAALD
ncbi:trichohyalin-like isoform X2 [Anopheles albimanus]|uniref:RPGRIP1 C-terminal domain-containing protein n=1 Tax=Anopheles albimanus TaxID=7167 RepID=A0A182FFC0_ANOAL|nr:trichohyalin-like isoform X2 [Anopheles albimanus]